MDEDLLIKKLLEAAKQIEQAVKRYNELLEQLLLKIKQTQESEMGFYINPKNMSKEEWLRRNGLPILSEHARIHSSGEFVLVCLVDNGNDFTAAGIAYDDQERDRFMLLDMGNQRPRKWFLVKRELLREFCDIL